MKSIYYEYKAHQNRMVDDSAEGSGPEESSELSEEEILTMSI